MSLIPQFPTLQNIENNGYLSHGGFSGKLNKITYLKCSPPRPRAKAGVDVRISQGEGNLGDIWSLGVIYSFIFLLSNYYAPGTVLATVKQE